MLLMVVLSFGARAQSVAAIATIAALRSDVTPGTANVSGWAALGDGGGGQFVSASTTGTSCTDDGGVVIRAIMGLTTLCWYRQFTGPVHLAWYGIHDTSITDTPDATAALKSALAIAGALPPSSAASPSTSRTVDTDALRFSVTQSIEIPADVRLTCDATPGAQRVTSSLPDYTNTPASIVLTSTSASITMTSQAGGPHNNNPQLDHCIVLTTGNGGNIILNPSGIQDAMQDIRNMVANASTAIICTAGGCDIHDNLLIGFDVGIEVDNGAHPNLARNEGDVDIGVYFNGLGSPGIVDGLEIDSFLTHGIDTEAQTAGTVSSGTGGVCHIPIGSSSHFEVHDPVYVDLPNNLNCNGLAFVSAKDGSSIELENTPYSPPSGVSAAWTAGSAVVSLAPTGTGDATGIWPGQTVTCSGTCTGFPAGTVSVVDVSKYTPLTSSSKPYRIVLSALATGTVTTGASVAFTNTTQSSSNTVSLIPGQRPASGASPAGMASYGYNAGSGRGTSSCIIAGTYGAASGLGIKIDNSQCFGHQVSYLFNAANPGGCFNCSADSHAPVEDLTQIALLVRGDQTGSLTFSGMAGAAGGSLIVDVTGNHCTHVDSSSFVPQTVGAFAVQLISGCFTSAGLRGNSILASDWLIEKGIAQPVTATIDGSVSENSKVYFDLSAGAPLVDCVNNVFAAGSSCQKSLTGTSPLCGFGCTSVQGTNNAMAITTPPVGVTSTTVNFAPALASAPICLFRSD